MSSPLSLVEDTFEAARNLLPILGDGRGGYLLAVERQSETTVNLKVTRLKTTRDKWSEAPLAEFGVRCGDDVVAAIHEHIPGLPLCKCGCGAAVLEEGRRRNGHIAPPFGLTGSCVNGHVLTDEITGKRKDGKPFCLLCRRASASRSDQRRRAAA